MLPGSWTETHHCNSEGGISGQKKKSFHMHEVQLAT